MRLKSFIAGLLLSPPLLSLSLAGESPAVLAGKLAPEQPLASRVDAAEALGKGGQAASEAVPALLKALKEDREPAVRHHAAWALGKIKVPADKIVPGLVDALKDDDWAVRHNSAMSLEWIGLEAAPALKAAASDSSPVKSAGALLTLINVQPSQGAEMMPRILELLKSDNPGVKRTVACAAGKIGEPARDAVPLLVEMLKDKDANVRRQALESVRSIRLFSDLVLNGLRDVLKSDGDRVNRITAALALGEMGKDRTESCEALLAAFKDKDARVRETSVLALAKIGAPAVPSLAGLLKSETTNVRALAAMALGNMRGQAKAAVSALTPLLGDKELVVRISAADAIGMIGDDSSAGAKEALEKARAAETENTAFRAHLDLALATLAKPATAQ